MDGYTVEVAATTVNRPPNGSASSTLAPSTMKNKNQVMSEMIEKYNSTKEEHQKIHLWTLGLMAAGLIDKTTTRQSENPRMKANIANSPDPKILSGEVV